MKKLITPTILAAACALALQSAEAATKKRITFERNQQTLVGDLYLPDNYQPGDKLPGLVVSGSWTSVKEQMAGGYAEQMANRGFAALAFDFTGWGESEGSLRYVEDPTKKTLDIIAAADFLASLPEVDNTKIGSFGICASAGYATDAALMSPTIKATALVAPWLHDGEIVDQVYGGKEVVNSLISQSIDAQQRFEKEGVLVTVPAASNTDETAIMYQAEYYTDPQRGAIPAYDNLFNLATWQPWLNYDAIKTAKSLTKPTLLVHSHDAAIPQGAEKFAAEGGDNIELVMLDKVTQFEFYDDQSVMKTASDKVAIHFANSFAQEK